MINKAIDQDANGDGKFNQAGRDIVDNSTTINITSQLTSFFIYEEDIKEMINFFHNNINNFNDIPFPDNSPIYIEDKNKLNNLSSEYYKFILEKSLPHFGKIYDFLQNPRNGEYVELYNSISEELQSIVLTLVHTYKDFQSIFLELYNNIALKCRLDKEFMKKRTKVLLFLHFMYYNCDIGLK